MTDRLAALAEVDPAIHDLIRREQARQEQGLELIASENFVSRAVLEAMGSVLTNKYAEGLPRKRYYGGCEVVDAVEQLAIDRARSLFGAEHANVQPHAGAQANMAAFFAFLEPGDTILGMSLPHGGHLTHGSPVNFSGKWFDVVFRALVGLRRLRGTAMDPFGRSHVRRVERALVNEYRTLVEKSLTDLAPETYERAVQLASLPDVIRGEPKRICLAPEPLLEELSALSARLETPSTNGSLVLIGRRHLRTNNSWSHNVPGLGKGQQLCTLVVGDQVRHGLLLEWTGRDCPRPAGTRRSAAVRV